jgi:transposase
VEHQWRHVIAESLAVFAKHVVHPERSEENGVATRPFNSEEAPDEASSLCEEYPVLAIALGPPRLVRGLDYAQAAEGFAVSVRTVAKWVGRFRTGGVAALEDALSRPGAPPHQTPPGAVALIRVLREEHGLPAWAIGRALHIPRSTVSAWLRRLGLNRPPAAPVTPIQRYEWPQPGHLLHIDIKPIGRIDGVGHRIHGDRRRRARGVGWEYVRVAVDNHSRNRLRGGPGGPARAHLCRVSPARGDVVGRAGHCGAPSHERQRRRLRVARLPAHVCRPRPAASAHARLYAADEWQGRTFNPDALRDALPFLPSASIGTPPVCAFLQSPATAREPRPSGSLVTAHERCVMNNVLELNSERPR